MTTNSSLKTLFDEIALKDFWCSSSITNKYESLAKKTVRILLFLKTHLCETGFPLYTYTKIKYRNKLDAEANILIQLSSMKPNFKTLVNDKNQYHCAH